MVTVSDLTSGLIRSSEVTAHHDMAGNVTFIEAAVVGDNIPMSVDVVLSASNMNLVITSSSLNTLIVDTVRINSNGGSSHMTYAVASAVTILENLSAEKYRSFKWFVTVSDGVQDKVKSLDIMAHQDALGVIKYSTYGVFGDKLKTCALEVVTSSGNIQLVMNNTSANNVTVDVMRIATLLKS